MSHWSFCLKGLPLLIIVATVAIFLLDGKACAQLVLDSEPKLISTEEYKLSDKATAAGIDGKILLAVTIDETGSVTKARVLSGPAWPCGREVKDEIEEVREEVRQMVMRAKFSPAIREGKPRKVDGQMDFLLGEKLQREATRRKAEAEMAADPSKRVVKVGVINGKAISLPKPMYPLSARGSALSGTVRVEVLVDEQGNVFRAQAISGHPGLHQAARDAACEAKFSPTILDGRAIRVSGLITYNFVAPRVVRPPL
jgi:TonB family protein